MEPIDVIILAGGLGTRLRKVVPDLPKPLAKIGDRPFLDILLSYLATIDAIGKVVLAISYLGEKIKAHYNEANYPFILEYSEETTPLGTGGGLKLAINKTTSEDLLVLNGDSYFELYFQRFFNFHKQALRKLTIACLNVSDVSRYGEVAIDPTTHQILSFSEKPDVSHPGLISGGVYLLKRNLLDPFPENTPFSLEKDVFPKLIGQEIYAIAFDVPFIDIGTKSSYLSAEKFFQKESIL